MGLAGGTELGDWAGLLPGAGLRLGVDWIGWGRRADDCAGGVVGSVERFPSDAGRRGMQVDGVVAGVVSKMARYEICSLVTPSGYCVLVRWCGSQPTRGDAGMGRRSNEARSQGERNPDLESRAMAQKGPGLLPLYIPPLASS